MLFAAEGSQAILVELSVMEQRYHAVMEVASGATGDRGRRPVWGVTAERACLAAPLLGRRTLRACGSQPPGAGASVAEVAGRFANRGGHGLLADASRVR